MKRTIFTINFSLVFEQQSICWCFISNSSVGSSQKSYFCLCVYMFSARLIWQQWWIETMRMCWSICLLYLIPWDPNLWLYSSFTSFDLRYRLQTINHFYNMTTHTHPATKLKTCALTRNTYAWRLLHVIFTNLLAIDSPANSGKPTSARGFWIMANLLRLPVAYDMPCATHLSIWQSDRNFD